LDLNFGDLHLLDDIVNILLINILLKSSTLLEV